MKKSAFRILSTGLLFSGLFLWEAQTQAGRSSSEVNFSATFVAGTCDITVSPENITWGSVPSARIRQAGEAGTEPHTLTIRYQNCNGYGITPRLIITGDTIQKGIPLFTRTNNTGAENAGGYGVRLVALSNKDIALDDNASIYVGIPGNQLSALEQTPTEFRASLSCGKQCMDSSLHGGAFAATVTFRFFYE